MDWLAEVLDARDARGAWRYPRERVRDFVAVLLLEVGFVPGDLTPEASALLEDFGARAGVVPGSSVAATEAAVRSYLAEHPIDPALLAAVRRASGRSRGSALDVAALLKYVAGAHTTWQPREPPKPGAVAGGPLAPFLAHQTVTTQRDRSGPGAGLGRTLDPLRQVDHGPKDAGIEEAPYVAHVPEQ